MRRTLVPAAAAAFTLLAASLAPAAQAAPTDTLAEGLITPLSLAVADDGTVYVSQNFAGMLSKVTEEGTEVVFVAPGEGTEVGAVSMDGGSVTFATTAQNRATHLWSLPAEGEATKVANLWRHEKNTNPDGGKTYGILGLTKSCKGKFTGKHAKAMLPYKGIKESHPYATTTVDGTTYVADAAANAIFAVADGKVSTLAVLPGKKVTITKKIRKALAAQKPATKLPTCVLGKKMKVEPVPTDIEVAPDGHLYVTSLPGGPEIAEMGSNGSVMEIDPDTGKVSTVAGGLVSPTGLALSEDTAFVSMLFPGLILSAPFDGTPSPFDTVTAPGDVEYANGKVYATLTDLFNDGSTPPNGQVVSWSPQND